MNDSLQAGDMALVLIGCPCGKCYAPGHEVEIVEPLAMRPFLDGVRLRMEPAYIVRTHTRHILIARPGQLARRKQDRRTSARRLAQTHSTDGRMRLH